MPGLVAPFPYFGGKRQAADRVWAALGDPDVFVEPFFGTGAVTLARPARIGGSRRREVANDVNAYVVNFWRAVAAVPDEVAAVPDEVAAAMDWPVHEADLEARHKWLVEVTRKRDLTERCKADPHYYDVTVAAYWCWGAAQWIGNGWCEGQYHAGGESVGVGITGPKLPKLAGISAVAAKCSVVRQVPTLSHVAAVHGKDRGELVEWLRAIAARFRGVLFACGGWERVVTDCVLGDGPSVGIFMDPPYGDTADCDQRVYGGQDGRIAGQAAAWAIATCIERPSLRVVFAGYEGEHAFPPAWRCEAWTARGGYGNLGDGRGKENRKRERLWMSPACARTGLFG